MTKVIVARTAHHIIRDLADRVRIHRSRLTL
jgi:hypothetical protein